MDDTYNKELEALRQEPSYRINRFVMTHTFEQCANNPDLAASLAKAKEEQHVIYHDDPLDVPSDGPSTPIIVKMRSFEAACKLPGKVAVLNFANNHNVGGEPYSASAQEESLCRTSTLYPCLFDAAPKYHDLHSHHYHEGTLDMWGNDDILFTPHVTVFKSDEAMPRMLEKQQWTELSVITASAPQFNFNRPFDRDRFMEVMSRRIKRILQVAKKEGVESLVLGAFGCGAFCNPPELVAKIFKEQLAAYHFDRVVFAIIDRNDRPYNNMHTFEKVFGIKATTLK